VVDILRLTPKFTVALLAICLLFGCRSVKEGLFGQWTAADRVLNTLDQCPPSALYLGYLWYDGKIYCITNKDDLVTTYNAFKNMPDSFNGPPYGKHGGLLSRDASVEIFGPNGWEAGIVDISPNAEEP